MLRKAGLPMVFYDRICTGVDVSRVVVDDYMGAFNAVSYMVKTGCTRIAFYGSSMNLVISKNRFNGYKDALLQNGLSYDPSLTYICDNRSDAETITPEVMAQVKHPDAFFAVNDDTAIGILITVKRLGFKVPQDISICGFSNAMSSLACEPMLTTVEQRGKQVGEEAASILIDQVEGRIDPEKVVKRLVRTKLVIRGTTR
jgi:LacI family transcriptional regulator/LacI family repressor for deo operon, udp, cdd, tsx, nupC, and nupG